MFVLCKKTENDDFKPITWGDIKKTTKRKNQIIFGTNLHGLIRKLKPNYFRNDKFRTSEAVVFIDNDDIFIVNEYDILSAVYDISEEMGEDLPPILFDWKKIKKEIFDLMGSYKKGEICLITPEETNVYTFRKGMKTIMFGKENIVINIARNIIESGTNYSFIYIRINTDQKIEGDIVHENYCIILEGLPKKDNFHISYTYADSSFVRRTMTARLNPEKTDIYCDINGNKICGFDLI